MHTEQLSGVHCPIRDSRLRVSEHVQRPQLLPAYPAKLSLSDSSAYACGRQRALKSAFEHSTKAEPWPTEVLPRDSQRARAGGCRWGVLARGVGAHLLSLVGHPGDRAPKFGLCQHHQQLSRLPLYHLYLSLVTPY
mgnify:CR=1 FL=1